MSNKTLFDGIKAVADHERETWNELYAADLQSDVDFDVRHGPLFWRISDEETVAMLERLLVGRPSPAILEAGCGPGVRSLLLAEKVNASRLVLVDIAENAIECARRYQADILRDIVEYRVCNVATLPDADGTYECVWNAGVIEHYDREQIAALFREMLRVTKPGGVTVLGIPNRISPATLKAAVLGSAFGRRYLKWIPGYRFHSETLYDAAEMHNLLEKASGLSVSMKYAGSSMLVGTPEWLLRMTQFFTKGCSTSFLTYFIVQKPETS